MGIEELLDRQSGVVARLQLRAAGCDELDLARATADRGWRGVHPGVYVTGADPLTWLQRGWVALLLAWPAALCHRSALRVADGPGRRGGGDAVIHVAVDRDSAFVAPPGVRAHRLDGLGDRVRWDLSPPRVHVEEAVLEVAAEIAADAGGAGGAGGAAAGTEAAALAWLAAAVRCRRTSPERLHDALDRLDHLAAWRADPGRRELLARLLEALCDPADPDRDPGRRHAHRGRRTTIGLTSRADRTVSSRRAGPGLSGRRGRPGAARARPPRACRARRPTARAGPGGPPTRRRSGCAGPRAPGRRRPGGAGRRT